MRLSKLIQAVENSQIVYVGDWEREIRSLSVDSRKKQPSSLFFCLEGREADGHLYAQAAVKNGAVAIVTQKPLPLFVPQILVEDTREALSKFASMFHGKPCEDLKIIAVTGTNGKTTITHVLQSIFESSGKKVGIIGTLGVRYAGMERPCRLTTPDPIELHSIFAQMRSMGVEYVFMEVSAHALYYKKVAGIRFTACIFSNLTQDHLDFFPTISEYGKVKALLFSPEICELGIVNGDDEFGRAIGKNRLEQGGKTIFYGLNAPADAFAIITQEGLEGSECMFNVHDELCRARLSLSGRHNVYNALAATVCAVELGIPTEEIALGLQRLKKVKGRLEKVASYNKADIFVDFAHTPDGLAKSLDTLKKYCKGRLICLFGCGGNRDKGKRPLMGEVAARLCDFSVLTSDNPRYEDPLDILADVERGYRRFSTRYVIVPDRKRAIEYALDFLQSDDILLVAGKGGEEEQEIMGIKYPFNDQVMIEEFVAEKTSLNRGKSL